MICVRSAIREMKVTVTPALRAFLREAAADRTLSQVST